MFTWLNLLRSNKIVHNGQPDRQHKRSRLIFPRSLYEMFLNDMENKDCDHRPSNANRFGLSSLSKENDSFFDMIKNYEEEYESKKTGYSFNKVRTTKYTVLSFLPKNLFEQFHRFANFYFLLIIALNFVPALNAFAKEVSMLPLVAVLTLQALKDGYEDYARYRNDKQINNSMTDAFLW